MDRIKILLEFIEDEPNDPFNIYAVAIEYQKKDSRKALQYFENLLTNFPSYLATYYTAGKFLEEEIEDYGKAVKVYQKGIELAIEQKQEKAEKELQTALTNLLFELD